MKTDSNSCNHNSLSDEQKRALLVSLLSQANLTPEMSPAQERIWQLEQISPANPAYNFQSAIALTGPLNLAALTKAAGLIVARHETLRTTYGVAKGRPQLTLGDNPPLTIATIDLTTIKADEQMAHFQTLASQAAQTGFTIDQPLLFRLQAYRFAADHHILVLTMHHLISDLMSLDLFFSELADGYNLLIGGHQPSPHPPSWTYSDHARAEKAGRSALRHGPAGQFWRQHLQGAVDLSWRSDFPRPKQPTGQAGTVLLRFDADIVQAVSELARRQAVTPFVVLLSAYYVLQWALSGSDDQLVAVPVAGRNRKEDEGLIGMFSSPLPMRTQLSGQLCLPHLLGLVRRTVLATSEHASVPLADLVEWSREGGHDAPLALRSMFSFVSRIKKLVFADLQLERIPTNRGVSDFDLFLTVCEEGGAWHGLFEYSTDLFTAATAQDLADAFTKIVGRAIAQPDLTVAELAALVPIPPQVTIAVAATFTADLLAEAGQFWQDQLRAPLKIEFSPYNQIFQSLLQPDSLLHRPGNTLNVLLVRPEDWFRYDQQALGRSDALIRTSAEFVEAIGRARLAAPLIVCLCPASPNHPASKEIAAAEQYLKDELDKQAAVTLIEAHQALAPYVIDRVFDAATDSIAHIPFSRSWFITLGTELVRRATSLVRPPAKVIALDCDQTLWRGVCGEDGTEGVEVDEPFRVLQQFIGAQAEQGMLLCLVSKNDPNDVFDVFEHNPGMILRPEQFIAHRINWQPKSSNLVDLAAELNLGLDSFIFIDDNPLECAEVQAACPEVLTLCLPPEAADIPSFLPTVWAFDRFQISSEDRLRHSTMVENRHRRELRQQTDSFAEFIANLKLEVKITPADEDSLTRIAQLSHRTNQFNNGGIRYQETQLRQILTTEFSTLQVRVADRFGSYGMVGALIYHPAGTALHIDNFLLSCRALGRGVEHHMLAELGRIALAAGLVDIVINLAVTQRNLPFRQFIAGLGTGTTAADGNSYLLPAAKAAETVFVPGKGDPAPMAAAQVRPNVSATQIIRQAAMAALAGRFRTVDDIVQQIDRQGWPRRTGNGGPPPRGKIESAIAGIWQKVLHSDSFSRDDNFFAAGGNSLLLVQINSELIEHFGLDIPILALFQYPTIASLAEHLGSGGRQGECRTEAVNRGEKSREGLKQRMMGRVQRRQPQ